MTSILLLGSTGLLGSTLATHFNVYPFSHRLCDITDPVAVTALLGKHKPEIIINCAGLVPKAISSAGDMHALRTNALGPKLLRAACNEYGTRLIHVSTDCVFAGSMGNYTEDSLPNPTDIYGMSKYLGEVYDPPHLTIRTSFVGYPDAGCKGLLHWLSKQTQAVGWDRVWWNGLTALEFGKILFNKILPKQVSGLVHLHGETVSKYDLLVQARDIFGWNTEILQESKLFNAPIKHIGNRTLSSNYPELQTTKSLQQMLQETADNV